MYNSEKNIYLQCTEIMINNKHIRNNNVETCQEDREQRSVIKNDNKRTNY